MQHYRSALLAACAWWVATSGVAQEAEQAREVDIDQGPPPAEEGCFFTRDVRNFSALSDRYVYLEGRRGEHFLLTMAGTCFGLDGAVRIALSSDIGRVCSLSAASITYRGLGQLETCRIQRVERVEDRAAAESLAEFRARGD